MPKRGDIVLIPVPFSDLTSQKRRPVVVISNDTYQKKTHDNVVVAMTSNIHEIDYLYWFFGSVSQVFSITEKFSVSTLGLKAGLVKKCR